MIRRILCFLVHHDFQERPYAEIEFFPYSSLEVCRRCGKVKWGEPGF